MITASLRDRLAELMPWVSREYRFWWRSWDRDALGRRNDGDQAPDFHGCVADALAAALVADRGEAGAWRAAAELLGDDPALCCAVRLRLRRPLPGPHRLVDGIDSPPAALAVYVATLLVIDGSRPGGRVWLEDLAEALLLPPILIRQLHRHCGMGSSMGLAASA